MLNIKIPFRKHQFDARKEAILDAVNSLLAEKGFDLMTMDDVADRVGIAKGSLYKHFSSKEKLAAAALTRLLRETNDELDRMPADWRAIQRLEQILRWSIHRRLQGGVPFLPSTRGALQRSLMLSLDYMTVAYAMNKRFRALASEARASGDLATDVSDDVIVFTLYSRSCDPTVEFLRQAGTLSDEQIVESMVAATFGGIRAR